jgi:multiple sugar transport system permease protein
MIARRRRARWALHRKQAWQVITFVLLLVVLGFFMLPIYWTVVTSLKLNKNAFDIPPELVPMHPTLSSYGSQLTDRSGFLTYFINSVITATGTTVLTIIVAVLAGYAFSRFRFFGRRWLLVAILTTQMFPATLIVVGIYVTFRELGLLDSYLGLVLAFSSFALPFSIWMIDGFFRTVPRELEDAAMIDGSTRLGALWRVIVPLTAPGVVAVGVFAFLNSWNNLLFALSLTSSQGMRTIPPGFLLTYVGEFQYYWSDAMAGSVIVTVPMVVLFLFLQRYLVQGISAGAVKG